jgi:hypothetical protein
MKDLNLNHKKLIPRKYILKNKRLKTSRIFKNQIKKLNLTNNKLFMSSC